MSALPKKIYLNYVDENDEETTWSEESVSVYDCKMKNREYTDLSQVWHDADDEPLEGSSIIIMDANDKAEVIFYLKFSSLGGYKVTWGGIVKYYKINKWAYIADILPKGGGK